MSYSMTDLAHQEITEQIIGAAFEVYKHLGHGFLESVYRNAMLMELRLRGLAACDEEPIEVSYKGSVIGQFKADLLVENCVIVELKIAKEYQPLDEPQLLNELKATGIKVGLLINFGKSKVAFKRFVY
ncbi:MAG: GxxExxY protein [Planctomycetaceae bacterium]|nr:GxxExxY protein [Planctomycetaceae bacterium]